MSAGVDVTFDGSAWERLELAVAQAPYGYLLGQGVLAGRRVRDVVPGGEVLAGHDERLVLSPGEWVRVERDARGRGWDILGVYHVAPQIERVPDLGVHGAVDQGLVLCLVARDGSGALCVTCFEREEDAFPGLRHGRG